MTPQTKRAGLSASAVRNPAEPGTARLEERSGDALDLTNTIEKYLLFWWYYAWYKGVFEARRN